MFLDDITDGAYRCHASRRLFLPFASGHFLVSTQLGASLFSDEAEAVSRLDPWDGDCRRHCNKVHTPVTNVMRVHVRLEMWMFFPCGGLQIYTSPSWVHFHSLHAEAGVAGVGAKLCYVTCSRIGVGVEATRGGGPEHTRRESEIVCEVGELLSA